MDQEPLPIASVSRGQPYDFHDEKFVTWWLNSLYLFSTQDQLAIAQLLRNAIHAPEAAREIEAFVTIRTRSIDRESSSDAGDRSPLGASADGNAAAGLSRAVTQIWQTSPWIAGLGVCAVALFLVKALWFAARQVYRLVF